MNVEPFVIDTEINYDDADTTTANKKTTKYMTKYEYTSLVAFRTIQLRYGDIPRINDIPDDVKYNSQEIARMELHARVIPLVIKRNLPNGDEEIWKVKDMVICNY